MAKYLVQRAEFDTIKRRAFGGPVRSYEKWRTLERFDTENDARLCEQQEQRKNGLFRTRVAYQGKTVTLNGRNPQ